MNRPPGGPPQTSSTTGRLTATELAMRRLGHDELRSWLPQLSEWLLPGASYPVEQTWPQIYRSDGSGTSLGIFAGDRLVSHLAQRAVTVQGERGRFQAGLIGSVATADDHRGLGLASRLLATAIQQGRTRDLDVLVLWAERIDLYAAHGFAEVGTQWQFPLLREEAPIQGVRNATFADRAPLLRLHQAKPQRVNRDRKEMELLLSTPGMSTTVLERNSELVAYACSGKGADFQGWWHEFGGNNNDVAYLLRGSMQLLEQPAALVMLPAYRSAMIPLLNVPDDEVRTAPVAMAFWLNPAAHQEFFVDGLDSV